MCVVVRVWGAGSSHLFAVLSCVEERVLTDHQVEGTSWLAGGREAPLTCMMAEALKPVHCNRPTANRQCDGL